MTYDLTSAGETIAKNGHCIGYGSAECPYHAENGERLYYAGCSGCDAITHDTKWQLNSAGREYFSQFLKKEPSLSLEELKAKKDEIQKQIDKLEALTTYNPRMSYIMIDEDGEPFILERGSESCVFKAVRTIGHETLHSRARTATELLRSIAGRGKHEIYSFDTNVEALEFLITKIKEHNAARTNS